MSCSSPSVAGRRYTARRRHRDACAPCFPLGSVAAVGLQTGAVVASGARARGAGAVGIEAGAGRGEPGDEIIGDAPLLGIRESDEQHSRMGAGGKAPPVRKVEILSDQTAFF